MKYLCPSILAADFLKLGEDIKNVENLGADIIHCDVMDGAFVPNISFGPMVISKVNEVTELPLDVHLMIDSPDRYIKDFAKAGADYISVHYENNYHLNRVISSIKDLGIKAGVVLNPATPVMLLKDIISYTDFILIMSVNPGFGGQKFINGAISKIKELKSLINDLNPNCLIEVDGGVGLNNLKELSNAGADMFVCGASIFGAEDREKTVHEMKNILQES